jgi:cell division topological specificity factor
VDVEAITINVERDSGHEVLELSVALPDNGKPGSTAPVAG